MKTKLLLIALITFAVTAVSQVAQDDWAARRAALEAAVEFLTQQLNDASLRTQAAMQQRRVIVAGGPVDHAAQTAAAQSSNYAAVYAPFVVKDVSMDAADELVRIRTDLLTLSTNLAAVHAAEQRAVDAYLSNSPIHLERSWTDSNGGFHFIDHIDAGGALAIKSTHNVESAQTVGAQKLWPGGSTGFNLTGSNVLIAEWDSGDVLTNHVEFATNGYRVFMLNGPFGVLQGHATHVAGTIIAWGVDANAKGFSHRARLVVSQSAYDLQEMPGVAATLGVRESNHSYGDPGGWSGIGTANLVWGGDIVISTNQDWHFGFYDGKSKTNDQIIYTAQTYLPVFSAGNLNGVYGQPETQPVTHDEYSNDVRITSTQIRPSNGAQGGFNTLTRWGVSKNHLLVGAVGVNTNGYTGTNSVSIWEGSSWGPTADGRIKPDVVAPGVFIYSTQKNSNTQYGFASGTSQAAPAVTGTLGLLSGFYQQLYPTNAPLLSGTNAPLSSTLRGIVIHTADQLGTNFGPSYTYGWGLLNAPGSAIIVTNNFASGSLAYIKEVRLVSGDRVEFPVTLTNGVPFRATITWTDPPGTPTSPQVNPTNHMLVNDLDLRVLSPTGTTNYPYVLNRASPSNAATKADNNVDNVEQVYISSPTNGTYIVRVTHKGNLLNDQGQTSYQNLSILLSGNLARPATTPAITSISAITASNTMALAWSSDVGRVYRVQYVDALASSNDWLYASGELSATKTNTAFVHSTSGVTNRYYRIVQLR